MHRMARHPHKRAHTDEAHRQLWLREARAVLPVVPVDLEARERERSAQQCKHRLDTPLCPFGTRPADMQLLEPRAQVLHQLSQRLRLPADVAKSENAQVGESEDPLTEVRLNLAAFHGEIEDLDTGHAMEVVVESKYGREGSVAEDAAGGIDGQVTRIRPEDLIWAGDAQHIRQARGILEELSSVEVEPRHRSPRRTDDVDRPEEYGEAKFVDSAACAHHM